MALAALTLLLLAAAGQTAIWRHAGIGAAARRATCSHAESAACPNARIGELVASSAAKFRRMFEMARAWLSSESEHTGVELKLSHRMSLEPPLDFNSERDYPLWLKDRC
jgi:hypothetical protein